jgi:hypothetical protein
MVLFEFTHVFQASFGDISTISCVSWDIFFNNLRAFRNIFLGQVRHKAGHFQQLRNFYKNSIFWIVTSSDAKAYAKFRPKIMRV